jgi:hypothetical protein
VIDQQFPSVGKDDFVHLGFENAKLKIRPIFSQGVFDLCRADFLNPAFDNIPVPFNDPVRVNLS